MDKRAFLILGVILMLGLVGASNNYYIDSSTGNLFFINGTSGLIGFNTTTPQNTLNVVGNGNFTGNLYVNGEQVGGSGTFVPYTGATANLDLGNNNFSIGTSELFVNSNTGMWHRNNHPITEIRCKRFSVNLGKNFPWGLQQCCRIGIKHWER